MTWSVVIPSGNAENLCVCVAHILAAHPGMQPERIVVVDDGARSSISGSALPSGVIWLAGTRPFVFARNVNLGIAACPDGHVVVIGDDGSLETRGGFDLLEEELERNVELGVVSAAIRGSVGNERQKHTPTAGLVAEPEMLAFVCVMIRRETLVRVGLLDESFTGYGFDDVDYCWRVRANGWALGTSNRCVVRHDRSAPSVYRERQERTEFEALVARNRALFLRKWGRL